MYFSTILLVANKSDTVPEIFLAKDGEACRRQHTQKLIISEFCNDVTIASWQQIKPDYVPIVWVATRLAVSALL